MAATQTPETARCRASTCLMTAPLGGGFCKRCANKEGLVPKPCSNSKVKECKKVARRGADLCRGCTSRLDRAPSATPNSKPCNNSVCRNTAPESGELCRRCARPRNMAGRASWNQNKCRSCVLQLAPTGKEYCGTCRPVVQLERDEVLLIPCSVCGESGPVHELGHSDVLHARCEKFVR